MKLHDFEKKLQEASEIKELETTLSQFLTAQGVSTFAFTFYSYHPKSIHKLKYDFTTHNLKIWHKHFHDEGYDRIDSTLDVVYQTTLPIIWDVREQIEQSITERERQMRKDSLKFGTLGGISVPIHGPEDDFAILTLFLREGETWLQRVKETKYIFLICAQLYYSLLKNLVIKKPKQHPFGLSARQLECLLLLTQNLTLTQIATAMHITERTVNFHIQHINKKLGSKNKYQSIAKAIRAHLT